MVVFESEDAAGAAADMIRNGQVAPDTVTVESRGRPFLSTGQEAVCSLALR